MPESLRVDVYPTYKQFMGLFKQDKYEVGVNVPYPPIIVDLFNKPGGAKLCPPDDFVFSAQYSPSVTDAIVAWAKQWNLYGGWGEINNPFIHLALSTLGSRYMVGEPHDAYEPGKLTPVLSSYNRGEGLPSNLKEMTYEVDIEFSGFEGMTRKQVESHYKRDFQRKLVKWLDEREQFDYLTQLSPKPRNRIDERKEYFKWLSH